MVAAVADIAGEKVVTDFQQLSVGVEPLSTAPRTVARGLSVNSASADG